MKKLHARQLVLLSAALCAANLVANTASASMYITEWMYDGNNISVPPSPTRAGEFIEFTNLGTTAVDMTGWSFDDDSQDPGTVDLSAFGIVSPGESVILSEAAAVAFIANWGLSGVSVIGGNATNLGRNDQINLYDADGNLVDSLTFGDQTFPGTIRTQEISGNPASFAALLDPGKDSTDWVFSQSGDLFGSYQALNGDFGNPGSVPFAPVPLPATAWLLISGIAGLFGVARRRVATA